MNTYGTHFVFIQFETTVFILNKLFSSKKIQLSFELVIILDGSFLESFLKRMKNKQQYYYNFFGIP